MPELPEVEATRRLLAPQLVGRTIAELVTSRPSYFFLTPPARLRRELPGRAVVALDRHGKYLLASLDDGRRLLLHLGMTGQLFVAGAASPRLLAGASATLPPEAQPAFTPDEHTHLQLRFADGGPAVIFRDVRKFGKVKLLAAGASDPRLARLGPDALGVEGAHLHAALRGRRAPVKALLLDQSLLAGVGNIYADEALHRAGVRPRRAAGRLSRRECDALALAIRELLALAVEAGGSTLSDFVLPDGSDGGYQEEHRVYGRAGEPCLACGAAIRHQWIAARSSHYCPRCQPR